MTAKHVVEEHGLPRELLSMNVGGKLFRVSELWTHNQRDVALIDLEQPLCPEPHYPSHWSHEKEKGLIKVTYSPDHSKQDKRPIFYATHVKEYETSERIREDGSELIFEFEDQGAEGGNSVGCFLPRGLMQLMIHVTSCVRPLKTQHTSLHYQRQQSTLLS